MKQRLALDRRLAALLQRYGLPPHAAEPLRVLLDRLADDRAPTTVRVPIKAVEIHVADSLVALDLPELRAARRVVDLGSGAGVPGLVLAAMLPRARFCLVESAGRKGDFIAASAEAMGLTNVSVLHARAEAAPVDGADVVCARALASLPVLVEYAAPLLRQGGVLVAWKGSVPPEELEDGTAAAAATGLKPSRVVPVDPFPGSERRTLHVYRKVMETPPRFPRRAGMAVKRPLSANP